MKYNRALSKWFKILTHLYSFGTGRNEPCSVIFKGELCIKLDSDSDSDSNNDNSDDDDVGDEDDDEDDNDDDENNNALIRV
jgi:hypothetical protein